jgi:uncharacterized protein with gpF-like domain
MDFAKYQKDIEKVFGKLTKEAEKEIIANYKKALDTVRAQLANIYSQYEKNGELTLAEMSKYNRLDTLKGQIEKYLKDTTGVNAKNITKLSGEVYQESFYRTAFAFERQVQAKLGYGLLNPKVIQASVQNPISGLTLNETLEKNRDNIIIKVKQEITQGLVKGESYGKMANRFKEVLGNDAGKAVTVAQTEAHRNYQAGRLASGEQAASKGVEMWKVWEATLDDLTRDSHQALDQTKVEMDEDFESDGAAGPGPGMMGDPAQDINCRCTLRYELKGDYAPFERYSRDDLDEMGEIIPYTDYEDWFAAKGLKMQSV